MARTDLTSALDEAGVSYELLPHAHTESALAEARALGVSPDDVAKTLVVKTPGGYVRVVLPASARLDLRKLREIHGGGRHAVHLATEEDLRRDYPEFELEIVLTHQDELRVHRAGKAFRRHGWVVTGRRLLSVAERRLLATPAEAAGLLPLALPELFDTAELAQAAGIERRLAQQMTYCLRAMGVLDTAGKRSGAVLHRRAA